MSLNQETHGGIMKPFELFPGWLEAHKDLAYALIRIYLGLALFVRGWLFLADPSSITSLAGAQQVYMWYSYIIGAHLVGGLLLALGVMTRIAALIQIPILAGAIVFIHMGEGLMTVGQSLELAVLVLFLLVVVLVFGSGSLAVGSLLREKKNI
jgi:uncharacterized membrane protein YphA (DoxX/SURF4 family)